MNVEKDEALLNLRRLSINSAIEEIPAIEEHKCMWSLLIVNNKNFKSVTINIFRKLKHIHVLVLSGKGILIIPESVGNSLRPAGLVFLPPPLTCRVGMGLGDLLHMLLHVLRR